MPAGWEVGGFQFKDGNGLFAFASESGEKGQFTFRKVDGVPDIPRIIEEIHRRDRDLDAPPKMKFTRYGRHDGSVVLATARPGERFYASAFHAEEQILNEWIFPRFTEENVKEVIPMLESYTKNPADSAGRRLYAMFGLEVSVPQEFEFLKVEPYPASIAMYFENRHHHRLEAHRWGMTDMLLQGADTLNYYHRFLYSKKYQIRETSRNEKMAQDNGIIHFRTRGKFGMDFLLGPWWTGEGAAFLNRDENRIYGLEHIAPKRYRERETLETVFARKLGGKHA